MTEDLFVELTDAGVLSTKMDDFTVTCLELQECERTRFPCLEKPSISASLSWYHEGLLQGEAENGRLGLGILSNSLVSSLRDHLVSHCVQFMLS